MQEAGSSQFTLVVASNAGTGPRYFFKNMIAS